MQYYYLAVVLVAALVLLVGLGISRKWPQKFLASQAAKATKLEERERERQRFERERDREVASRIQEGTHVKLATGELVERCALCPSPATHPGVRFDRDHGLWAWMRERLGAPRSYTIGFARFDAPVFCRVHVHLVTNHYQLKLQHIEQQHARQRRDDEIELQSFERGGALDELRELTQVIPRRARAKDKSKVVSLVRGTGG